MPFCRKCDGYIYADPIAQGRPHQCPPEWELIMEDECSYAQWGAPEWTLVYGRDQEEAAEKWAELHDQGGDYDIVQGNGVSTFVYIRKPADEDFIGPTLAQRWAVFGESVPRYSAEREELR